jgi:hypothetical protein
MSTARKKTSHRARDPFRTSKAFSKSGCEEISYTFDVTRKHFDLRRFLETTGIEPSAESWSGILRARDLASGYHVHFDGNLRSPDSIELRLRYYNGSARPLKGETEPFAESLMTWIGQFFGEPSWRASVNAQFIKPTEDWRSRFNLPFKVTMSDAEVTIDGVTISLPANNFGASACWISRTRAELIVGMLLFRRIEFTAFNLFRELAEFDESTKIVIEEVKS